MRTSFSSWAINMLNYLSVNTTNFSSLSNFNKTVSNTYLLTFCKMNLAWLWSGYLNGFVSRFVFLFYMFSCVYHYFIINYVAC